MTSPLKRDHFRISVLLGMMVATMMVSGCALSGGQGEPDHFAEASIFGGLMAIYDGPLNHLAGVRRGSCPMHPSCSAYSRQAVATHGAAIGWAMTMDRLMRCGRNELQTAPRILVDGQWKYYDPLEANDRWWYAREDSQPRMPSIH